MDSVTPATAASVSPNRLAALPGDDTLGDGPRGNRPAEPEAAPTTAAWRRAVDLLRQIPDLLADRMDRWVMDVHRPNERTRQPPLAGRPNCWACSKPWPCKHHIDAADRHGARANRRDAQDA